MPFRVSSSFLLTWFSLTVFCLLRLGYLICELDMFSFLCFDFSSNSDWSFTKGKETEGGEDRGSWSSCGGPSSSTGRLDVWTAEITKLIKLSSREVQKSPSMTLKRWAQLSLQNPSFFGLTWASFRRRKFVWNNGTAAPCARFAHRTFSIRC